MFQNIQFTNTYFSCDENNFMFFFVHSGRHSATDLFFSGKVSLRELLFLVYNNSTEFDWNNSEQVDHSCQSCLGDTFSICFQFQVLNNRICKKLFNCKGNMLGLFFFCFNFIYNAINLLLLEQLHLYDFIDIKAMNQVCFLFKTANITFILLKETFYKKLKTSYPRN